MYLKLMSGEDAPDGDSRKTFRMLSDVIAVNFERQFSEKEAAKPEHRLVANRGPKATVTFKAVPGSPPYSEAFWPDGNCYLLNDAGDTIASFGVAPYVKKRYQD